jgi:hypothetical protein
MDVLSSNEFRLGHQGRMRSRREIDGFPPGGEVRVLTACLITS